MNKDAADKDLSKENKEVDSIFSFDYIKLIEKRELKKKTQNHLEQNDLKAIDIFSLNEIDISEKIKQLPKWSTYTNPILYSSPIQNMNKILLVKERMDISLLSFVRESKINKKYTVQTIAIYNSLLKILKWSEENVLVSLSCELDKIYLDKHNRAKLGDFSRSFFRNDFDLFKNKDGEVTAFHSLGIHTLKYLTQVDSLSSNNISEICKQFIDGLVKLQIFSSVFLREYESKCIFSLQSFINMKKERIILELLKGSSYWDHFSTSLMFLFISNQEDFRSILLNNIMHSRKNEVLSFC